MESVHDTKYRNQSRLETWIYDLDKSGVAARATYERDEDGRWTVTVEAHGPQATIKVTSGTQDSIEAGCVAAIDALREAHQTVP